MLQRKRASYTRTDTSTSTFVPLQHVAVDARIRSFAADVTICQVFRNQEAVPIEAVYCFPIEEQAAIYAFVARIGDREIVAELKEKKDAQREYDTALREHHGAYLFEQDEASPDNFIINVGALPPNEQCEIRISYVSELDLVQNGTIIRFVIPTTIAPRYNPNVGAIDSPVRGIPTEYVQSAPYTINFHCQVDKSGIARVSSLSHPIQVDLNGQDAYQIDFAQQNTHLDRDIIIDLQLAEQRSNTIVAVESGAIMAALTPTEDDCRSIAPDGQLTNEFIFIIDCSGSMDNENKIGLAREAMLLFLKSLPVGCLFNIIRFGSDHKSLFETVTDVYNEKNALRADELCASMKANMGGTELLRPLEWLQRKRPSTGHSRQIFLLSDGEVSNVDEVTQLCRSMATSTRIFSFGLGSAPSRSLIKGLARSTNGRFVFIPPHMNVDLYVGEQLQKALQPALTNVQIKLNVDPTLVDVIPCHPPPVFVHDRLVVYALLKDKQSSVFDQQVTVELHSEQHRLCIAQVNRIPSVADDDTIARLAAKARIVELQHLKASLSTPWNATGTNEEIIRLSLQYHILSPLTAFIGVEKRTDGNNADLVVRHVPIEIAADNPYDSDCTQQLCYAQVQYQHDKSSSMSMKQIADELEHAAEEVRFSRSFYHHDRRDMNQAHSDFERGLDQLSDIVDECHATRRPVHSHEQFKLVRNRCEDTKRNLDEFYKEYSEKQYQLKSAYANCERLIRNHGHRSYDHGRYRPQTHRVSNYFREEFADSRCFEEAQRTYTNVMQSLHRSDFSDNESSTEADNDKNQRFLQEHKRSIEAVKEYYYDAQRKHSQYEDYTADLAHHAWDASQELNHRANELFDRSQRKFENVSTQIQSARTFVRQQQGKTSKNKFQQVIEHTKDKDFELVRGIIAQQQFDGLWNVDEQTIQQLTNKSLSDFEQLENTKVLITAVIVAAFEERFVSLSPLWYGVVRKARTRLTQLLNNDKTRLEKLFEKIRSVLLARD